MAKGNQQNSKGIPFSIVSCVVGTFLVLACIALAYIAGVMSGRASVARDNVRLGNSQTYASTASTHGDEKSSGVLSPEELEYARALRSDMSQRSKKSAVSGNAGVSSKKEPSDVSLAQLPVSTEEAISRQQGMHVENQNSLEIRQSSEKLSSQSAPAMFDYVFQVAAMRTEDSVDALRQRLEGRGLRTRMQREGKMYYVLVLLRGDEVRATEVVQTLDLMHLGKPLIRSRKPVIQ